MRQAFLLAALFHCLQAADHRFNARAYLFIFLQERCPLRGQRVLPLLQRFILILQLVAYANQRIYALLESL